MALGPHEGQLLIPPWGSEQTPPRSRCTLGPLHTQRQAVPVQGSVPEESPLDSEWLPSILRQHCLWRVPLQTTAGLGACVSIPVVQVQAGRSDLGPPALDELHDLLDLKLGEVEVVCQDVLTELYKDAAIDTFSGKEAHHVL